MTKIIECRVVEEGESTYTTIDVNNPESIQELKGKKYSAIYIKEESWSY